MFSKSAIFVSFLAVAQLATAMAPACFLAAINSQQTLSDYKDICGNSASDVQSSIQSVCGSGNVDAALSAFSTACKAKGFTVPTPTLSSANSSVTATPSVVVFTSVTFDTSCSCSKTIAVTSTELAGASGVTTTGSAGTKATGSVTGSSTSAVSTGAAGRIEGSMLGGLLALGAGLAAAL